MALQSITSWEHFFVAAKIPQRDAKAYAIIFSENRITEVLLPDLTKDNLQDLGITILGDALSILRHARTLSTTPIPSHTATLRVPSAKLPQITTEMTLPQFRKFIIDWAVFKQITGITGSQIQAQLYSCCGEDVQNSLVNTITDIFTVSEKDLLKAIETSVTKRSNPSVHRMSFASMVQSVDETIQEYVVKLKSSAPDCEFACPGCNYDLQSEHIKDQFIRGLFNESLQTDILAKASHLKTLEDIIKHAEAFEAAMRDQQKLQNSSEVMAARSSYKGLQKPFPPRDDKPPSHGSHKQPCSGCGSLAHGQKNAKDRPTRCPAWGTTCHNCQIPNHFARVCRKKKDSANALLTDAANALVASVTQKQEVPTSNHTHIEQINIALTPCLPQHQKTPPIVTKVFPDSGASICLAGTSHLAKFNLTSSDLIPCNRKVTVVGGSTLLCTGWLPMSFSIGTYSTKQPLFICKQANRIYLSRKGCTDLAILPPSYPYPMRSDSNSIHSLTDMTTPNVPNKPTTIPFPAVDKNIDKLKQYLINKFKDTAFNKATPFPAMHTKPVHIHLKPDAVPQAQHVPIPVPYHWKDRVKQDLDADVARQIICPVPVGEPVKWCSKMLVTAKKDGSPRRVVDFQKLNAQCLRKTHHCPSPFQAASQVPANTKKNYFRCSGWLSFYSS